MSNIAVTHVSRCDQQSCVNFDIPYDVVTEDGIVRMVWCAGCNRDITHTATPKP